MKNVALRSGSRDEVSSLRDVLAMAIDLGFAKEKRSCGLAWRRPGQDIHGKKLRFGGGRWEHGIESRPPVAGEIIVRWC